MFPFTNTVIICKDNRSSNPTIQRSKKAQPPNVHHGEQCTRKRRTASRSMHATNTNATCPTLESPGATLDLQPSHQTDPLVSIYVPPSTSRINHIIPHCCHNLSTNSLPGSPFAASRSLTFRLKPPTKSVNRYLPPAPSLLAGL